MQINEQLAPELKEEIDAIVKKDKIVVFMKGNKDFPQCGFSDAVVKILKFYEVDFTTYDILSRPDLRSGMKIYSQWPTFPQLYINGEFVGGCDITMEMHQNGELQALVKA